MPNVAIIYLSYHADPHLPDVLLALKRMTYKKEDVAFVVVDNPHPDHGSSHQIIHDTFMAESGKSIPEVVILPQTENLGFAGGNNVGLEWALEHGYDYVLFHNDDGYLEADAVEQLVTAMEANTEIGIAQALVRLHPHTELINTSGNSYHYLGFGFGNEYKVPVAATDVHTIREIDYASGACMMVRASLARAHGGWDHDYFLYHEDMEWSFRMRTLGHKIVLVPRAHFYHKYSFARSIKKFYYMERNRVGLMLTYFKWPTLLLLAPMLLILEVGLWLSAWQGQRTETRKELYQYWLNRKHWKIWLQKRKNVQAKRQVSDRTLLRYSVPRIVFQEEGMDSPLLTWLGNPIMTVYYWFIRTIVIW